MSEEKTGASRIVARMNGLLKCRKGRRPVRAETLLKKGSQSGADLRLPLMGGTKFPTKDSLSQARTTLKEHQDVAKPKMTRPTVQPVYGVSTMSKSSSAFADDPLVQYLKKVAQSSKVDSVGKLEVNEEDLKAGTKEKELSSASVEPQRGKETHSEWRAKLNELFSNREGITGKFTDHHHPYKEGTGMVDKEIKPHTHK